MYVLWGRRLKTLNRRLKRWIEDEKENEEEDMCRDLVEVKELTVVALRLYRRLIRQEFVRVTDEQELFDKMELAVKCFNDVVRFYSTPPGSDSVVPFSEL